MEPLSIFLIHRIGKRIWKRRVVANQSWRRPGMGRGYIDRIFESEEEFANPVPEEILQALEEEMKG